ncbi:unnamed protein product [Cuscuta campestris]|uniref:CCT domain-containing protein n=1 Tax=Cuscuta campestris TaxID=132261 RepID=A0A484LP61_9ASTE|nr:unnamed protein product [Cuscuta campestris]
MHKKQQHISMVSSSSSSPCTKLAAAGAKPPRSCDACASKTEAQWFCPADDAFLCQNCDVSVHSANSLAGRHRRVRLRCSSPPSSPSWDSGFTRKPRTPRYGKRGTHGKRSFSILTKEFSHSSADVEHALVPEVYSTSDENLRRFEGEEEELIYRVPIIDPSVAEMCNSYVPVTSRREFRREKVDSHDKKRNINTPPSQFATEGERLLLGKGVEEEEGEPLVLDMEGLGLLSNSTQEDVAANDQNGAVLETDGEGKDEFDPENGGRKKGLLLKLDYEGVITAWAEERRPWSNGVKRQDLDPNDCWPVDLTPGEIEELEAPKKNQNYTVMDEEWRKERVYRYRQKRRNRLFSKKIRYQVRKLNAEKRPRIKGRFVKRPSLFDSSLHIPH